MSAPRTIVHLDLDVLDPSVVEGFGHPVPGGFSAEGLERMLAEVGSVAHVIGLEVTGCPGTEAAAVAASIRATSC